MHCGISFVLLLTFAASTFEQASTPLSPCPNVFNYEPPGTEPGRWYGVVRLSTDSTLHSLWLNIVLDSKADIVGNWVGDVTTQDNIDFKIENTKMTLNPGPAVSVRFFVQYNTLNKTPRLQAIRLNGREICNANNQQPDSGSSTVPKVPGQSTAANRHTTRPPLDLDLDVLLQPQANRGGTSGQAPVYVDQTPSNPNPSSIKGGEVPSQTYNVREPPRPTSRPSSGVTSRPTPRPTSRPRPPVTEDYGSYESNGNSDGDFFTGGIPTFIIPSTSSNSANRKRSHQCGRVLLNNAVPLVVNGTPTLEGQWPWQIALYQTQTVDNKYICGGTLVSRRHVVTAAHCVAHKNSRRTVDANTLTIYLGKHNLRTSVDGVQIRFVSKITIHPHYNASTFSRDLAILELREPVTYSNWIQPVCLWPENQVELNSIIGEKGSVVGWGFDETGVATEELSLVQMPIVDTETCIRSYSEFFVRFTSDYTYCAGYKDGTDNKRTGVKYRTSVCNGDSGGGMVLKLDDHWYLRGLVSLSVARHNEFRCDPSHYVVFTDLAKFLPWIKENIQEY